MKNIYSNSYKSSQQINLRFDPKRFNTAKNNPLISNLNSVFKSLSINSLPSISESDAMMLVNIQDGIRKKLRSMGVQLGL